jgi:glycosyltransferase involved in cell wall biosynthesis
VIDGGLKMIKDGLVSIIIPVYNSEKFLNQCLKSLLNQTYPEIEIIAVNDGSTDDSLKILNNYSDKLKIISQKNQGLASALNTGLDASNGKWFKWFSPDDLMLPETIETLITVAKDKPNTIVYSNWNIIDESEKFIRTFSESNFNELDSVEFNVRLLDGQQINVNTSIFPNSVTKITRFENLDDPILVDYDFFLRAALFQKTKFFLIEKPLIKYRAHKGQLSHKNILQSIRGLEKLQAQLLSKLDSDTRDLYLKKLSQYQKNQSFKTKFLKAGLNFSSFLPSTASDKILTFYLNKIRRTRN